MIWRELTMQQACHPCGHDCNYYPGALSSSLTRSNLISVILWVIWCCSKPYHIVIHLYSMNLTNAQHKLPILQCSRKAIGPSDIADDFSKCLMICSKSSDILSDFLKNFSLTLKLKCLMIVSKCPMICSKSPDIFSDEPKKLFTNIAMTKPTVAHFTHMETRTNNC